jgi:hypothetical protein
VVVLLWLRLERWSISDVTASSSRSSVVPLQEATVHLQEATFGVGNTVMRIDSLVVGVSFEDNPFSRTDGSW